MALRDKNVLAKLITRLGGFGIHLVSDGLQERAGKLMEKIKRQGLAFWKKLRDVHGQIVRPTMATRKVFHNHHDQPNTLCTTKTVLMRKLFLH